MKNFIIKFFFVNYFSILFSCILLLFLSPVFDATSVVFPYSINPFDIFEKYPQQWFYFKKVYIFTCFSSFFIISNSLYSFFNMLFFSSINFNKNPENINKNKNNSCSLLVGKNIKNELISIPINGLYQNALITGSIGSGKTSSLLYPLTEQLLGLNFSNKYKSAFLILDVKGNYHKFVKSVCKKYYHLSDLFIISLNGSVTYNPLDKPNLKPYVLANRLKSILLLFSPEQTESFWLDKAEQVLTEAIKLCRIYNNNYVTFTEIHKLIMSKSYYQEKIDLLKNSFYENSLSDFNISDLFTCISFFEDEFFSLDDRTQSIIKSEISRITNVFISDDDISRVFCPLQKDISFPGFEYILAHHKIVVLDMNISKYSMLSKIISAYLKIDFQSVVLEQLSNDKNVLPSCFICDEYHEYVTKSDSDFFAQSREAKSINIVATQSYSSILNTLKDKTCTTVLIQNLVNKFWFRTDDPFTIDEVLKQTGKEEKKIISRTISENARQTNYNFLFNSFFSKDSNLSESINTSSQKDFIYDTSFFSRFLNTFSCLAFISTGSAILPLQQLSLTPYFKRKDVVL